VHHIQVNCSYKLLFFSSKSLVVGWSSGNRDISQQLERLRPLLLQRCGRQKLIAAGTPIYKYKLVSIQAVTLQFACITLPVESAPFFIPSSSTSSCSHSPPGSYLILRIWPHHSHHLRSHHLSPSRPFTPDLNLYWTKWALAFVCFRFFFLADRTNSRAIGTVLRLSVAVCLSIQNVLWLNSES